MTALCKSNGKDTIKTFSGTAWQGNGMGTAWERHGMCELAFNVSIPFTTRATITNFVYSLSIMILI
jgi:hypothetical protein